MVNFRTNEQQIPLGGFLIFSQTETGQLKDHQDVTIYLNKVTQIKAFNNNNNLVRKISINIIINKIFMWDGSGLSVSHWAKHSFLKNGSISTLSVTV